MKFYKKNILAEEKMYKKHKKSFQINENLIKMYSWKYYLSRGLFMFVLLKSWMFLQNVIFPKPVFQNNKTEYSLEQIYDIHTDTFTLIDEKNVSFLLKPKLGCMKQEGYVVMALSAPRNIHKRDILR